MKNALIMLKSNPLTLASAIVAVLSVVFIVFWPVMGGSSLREDMKARETEIRKIERFMTDQVEVPPKRPDDPPQMISPITKNPAERERLKNIYGQMQSQFDQVFDAALAFNGQGHTPMLSNLFPTPASEGVRFDARDTYRRKVAGLLVGLNEQPVEGVPYLKAGLPPEKELIDEAVKLAEENYLLAITPPGATAPPPLTDEDKVKLAREQTAKAIEILQQRARAIDVYAVSDPNSADFPLDMQPFSSRPALSELWEAQMNLWIQSDIIDAIINANQRLASELERNSNAANNVVKRLIEIDVLPGYVGLHTAGGMTEQSISMSSPMPSMDRSDPSATTGRTTQPFQSAVGLKPPGSLRTQDDPKVSDNFLVSPTGRTSNGLYDVRHVRMRAIVDAQYLPLLFDALSRRNFMTVIDLTMTDVDEYEALQQYFIYGTGDAVQVDMLIETIWLREWTSKYMPPIVKQYLGLVPPTGDHNETPASQTTPGGPGGRGY